MDDISFQLTLYELRDGPVNFDANRLESLLFNPIDQAELHHSYSDYIDPDINLSVCSTISNYMVEESFSNEVISLGSNMLFSLLHILMLEI